MAQTEGPMTFEGVTRVFNDSVEIFRVWLGKIFVWPDPWTDIWDEGSAVLWENVWRDEWSQVRKAPMPEENTNGSQ